MLPNNMWFMHVQNVEEYVFHKLICFEIYNYGLGNKLRRKSCCESAHKMTNLHISDISLCKYGSRAFTAYGLYTPLL